MIQYFTARRLLLCFMILFLIGLPLTSRADSEVTLQWDANSQNPEGYMVFGHEEGQDYDYETPWWQGDGSFTQCTIDGLDESKTYYFVVRAFAGDDVSADSNEVRYAYGNSVNASSGGGGGGGGSSSGCFINSLFQSKHE